ncbi:MAG: hemolysin family protein, partial [Planctomycetota bacterium]
LVFLRDVSSLHNWPAKGDDAALQFSNVEAQAGITGLMATLFSAFSLAFFPAEVASMLAIVPADGLADAAASAVGNAADGDSASSSDYVLLLIYLVVAIGFSFYCSVAEATLLSISPSFIATLGRRRRDGSLGDAETPESELDPNAVAASRKLAALKDNVDRPLAAILSLNTIAHTIGAAGVGAQAAAIWGSKAVGIASALMTLAILVLSEIIPKTIGALYWRRLASGVGTTIRWLIFVLFPLVWLSELLTKLLSGGHESEVVTEEEFSAMADLGLKHGLLAKEQSQLLSNMMRMREITVASIRTPRPVLIAMPEDWTVDEVLQKHQSIPVSRIPIHRETVDQITGMVLRSDILWAKVRGEGDRTLADLKRDVISVHENMEMLTLLKTFMDKNSHLAIVVDEYGGTDGVVTLEDLIETLFGIEIVDEHDTAEDLQVKAQEAWKRRAEKIGLVSSETH